MPRFYFDIRQGSQYFPDDQGQELDGLEAAKCHAAQLAGRATTDMPLKPAGYLVIVEVCDEDKQRVLTRTMAVAIEQPNASPHRYHPWSA